MKQKAIVLKQLAKSKNAVSYMRDSPLCSYPNLDFDTRLLKSLKIARNIPLDAEHSKFYKLILAIFEQSIFQIFAKHSNDLHNICSVLSRRISTKFKPS